MRKWLVLWLVSLLVVAAVTSVLMRAQGAPPIGTVLSSGDLGFRFEGMSDTLVNGARTDAAMGALVVRISGKWVPVRFGTLPPDRTEPR
jgi:hypothetical protein